MSSSSLTSLSNPSDQSRQPVPLMSNLLSVAGASDAALQGEITRTSQVIDRFVEQTNERLQTVMERNAQLEARNTVIAETQRREAERMHLMQMQAIQQLTQTMNQRFAEIGTRLGNLESKVQTLESTLTKRINTHTHNSVIWHHGTGEAVGANYGGRYVATYHPTTTANLE